MNIVREKYLLALKNRMDNGLIKVITGILRCGKSYLLFNLFYEFLRNQGLEDSCIIKIALDDDLNEEFREPARLSEYIRSRVSDISKKFYIMLDEIQFAITDEEFKHPEKSIRIYSVLNGLQRLQNVDIYVTGSNSRFLSKDVLTEFRGRGDEVHVRRFHSVSICKGTEVISIMLGQTI